MTPRHLSQKEFWLELGIGGKDSQPRDVRRTVGEKLQCQRGELRDEKD